MDRNNIISLPHDSLRSKSKKVGFSDPAVQQLADDMMAATLDWEDHRKHEFGVALAAVQVNQLQRVVVVRNNFDDKKDRSFVIMLNPKIVRKEGAMIEESEGCLSVKNLYGMVKRYEKVKVRDYSLDGKEFTIKAEGFLARVLQHEIDHTNGILFVDHIKGQDKFARIGEDGKLSKISPDEIDASDYWDD